MGYEPGKYLSKNVQKNGLLRLGNPALGFSGEWFNQYVALEFTLSNKVGSLYQDNITSFHETF